MEVAVSDMVRADSESCFKEEFVFTQGPLAESFRGRFVEGFVIVFIFNGNVVNRGERSSGVRGMAVVG